MQDVEISSPTSSGEILAVNLLALPESSALQAAPGLLTNSYDYYLLQATHAGAMLPVVVLRSGSVGLTTKQQTCVSIHGP